jgi:hypothetical protein
MTIIEPGSAASGIVARAKNIILQPSVEFDRIDQETPSVASLYTGYAIPLAAAAALAGTIGMMVFGVNAVIVQYKPSPIAALSQGLITFIFMLAGVWLISKIIDFLAPNFGGQKNEIKATQTAIYSYTAAWLAGLFAIFPPLSILGILGLYSFYLLYRGLPRLMKTPPEKAIGYTAAVIIVAIIVNIVILSLVAPVMGALNLGAAGGMNSAFSKHADPAATVSVPGFGEVKVGELEAKSKDLEAMVNSMKEGKSLPTIPGDTLKGLLPETLPGGFARTEVSTGSGGAMGFSGTTAEGKFTRGDSTIDVTVVDMGAAGAMMGMASSLGVEASREDANGYSKTGKVDGRMTVEEVDRTAKTASYSVVISDRIALTAEGQGVSADEVKAAVNAIGIARVEALAKASPQG